MMIDLTDEQAQLAQAADVLEDAGHKSEAGWLRALRVHLQRAEHSLKSFAPLIEAARTGKRGKSLDGIVQARRAAVKAEVEAEQRARAERKGRAP